MELVVDNTNTKAMELVVMATDHTDGAGGELVMLTPSINIMGLVVANTKAVELVVMTTVSNDGAHDYYCKYTYYVAGDDYSKRKVYGPGDYKYKQGSKRV